MKAYYDVYNFPTSVGKLFFNLDGSFNTVGQEYIWTLGKGIYGIFENDELIYVGETSKSFVERFRAHSKCVKENSSISEMYSYIKDNFEENKFCMRPLVEVDSRVKLTGELQLRDIQSIELGFITCFRPKFNIMGVFKEYKLNELLPSFSKSKIIPRKSELEYEEEIVLLEIKLKEKDLEFIKKEKDYIKQYEELEKEYKICCQAYDLLLKKE